MLIMDTERIHILVLLCTCFTLVQAINGQLFIHYGNELFKINTNIYKAIETSYRTAMSLWLIPYYQELKVLKYPNIYIDIMCPKSQKLMPFMNRQYWILKWICNY